MLYLHLYVPVAPCFSLLAASTRNVGRQVGRFGCFLLLVFYLNVRNER